MAGLISIKSDGIGVTIVWRGCYVNNATNIYKLRTSVFYNIFKEIKIHPESSKPYSPEEF